MPDTLACTSRFILSTTLKNAGGIGKASADQLREPRFEQHRPMDHYFWHIK
jgi:hypothetical protein